jgi:Dolichyl-phosphate-mannose-protein mannosyltransferase
MISKAPGHAFATECRADPEDRDERVGRRFVAVALSLAAIAAAWAIVGSAWIFPQLSANSDEGIYLLQADALSSGHLTPRAPDVAPEAFLPWFAVVREGHYVLKYTPVHAAVLAGAQIATGTPRVALALIAAVNVVLVIALARELGAGRRAALVGGAVFLASPLTILLSITFLPYGTSLSLLLGTAILASRAGRTGRPLFAVLAGALWGVAAFARPYDAVLGGAAIVIAIAVRERHRLPKLLRVAGLAAVAAAVPLLGLLVFDHATTGDPLQLPFNLLEPSDRLGFGLRKALPTDSPLDYTPGRGASAVGRNLLLVAAWTGGGVLACGLAVATLVRRRLRGGGLLVAVLVVWPLGYFFFWGSYMTSHVWDGALFLGPYYYLPLVAAISIAAGVGLVDAWRRQPAIGVLATVVMVALSAVVIVPGLADQRDRTSQRATVASAIDDEIVTPALVFVPPLYGQYLQNPLSFLRNRAALDGDTVYALDGGDSRNAEVEAAFPDRAVYRLVLANGWSDQPGFVPIVDVVTLRAPVPPG